MCVKHSRHFFTFIGLTKYFENPKCFLFSQFVDTWIPLHKRLLHCNLSYARNTFVCSESLKKYSMQRQRWLDSVYIVISMATKE